MTTMSYLSGPRILRTREGGNSASMRGRLTHGDVMPARGDEVPVSTKVGSAAAGSALATIIWTIVGAMTSVFSPTTIAALTGATATLAAFILGFFVPDSNDYIQSQMTRRGM